MGLQDLSDANIPGITKSYMTIFMTICPVILYMTSAGNISIKYDYIKDYFNLTSYVCTTKKTCPHPCDVTSAITLIQICHHATRYYPGSRGVL